MNGSETDAEQIARGWPYTDGDGEPAPEGELPRRRPGARLPGPDLTAVHQGPSLFEDHSQPAPRMPFEDPTSRPAARIHRRTGPEQIASPGGDALFAAGDDTPGPRRIDEWPAFGTRSAGHDVADTTVGGLFDAGPSTPPAAGRHSGPASRTGEEFTAAQPRSGAPRSGVPLSGVPLDEPLRPAGARGGVEAAGVGASTAEPIGSERLGSERPGFEHPGSDVPGPDVRWAAGGGPAHVDGRQADAGRPAGFDEYRDVDGAADRRTAEWAAGPEAEPDRNAAWHPADAGRTADRPVDTGRVGAGYVTAEPSTGAPSRPAPSLPGQDTDTAPGAMTQPISAHERRRAAATGADAGGPPDAPTSPPTASADRPSRGGKRGKLAAAGIAGVLLIGGVGAAMGYGMASHSGSDAPAQSAGAPAAAGGGIGQAAAKVAPSVVQLRFDGAAAGAGGSGSVLSADGLILTTDHLLDGARNRPITVALQDGRTAPAEIVGRDRDSDLAVLRASGLTGLVPVELGNSDTVAVGQQVAAVGSPLDGGGAVTSGTVSAVDRSVTVRPEQGATPTVIKAIQTGAAVNPRSSGGPLVDTHGQAIGINTVATAEGSGASGGTGFAIPMNQAKRVADQLVAHGKVVPAGLGVSVASSSKAAGVLVRNVEPGGPGAAAGIKQGDTIVAVDNRPVRSRSDYLSALSTHNPGDTVVVGLDGGRTVNATLGER